MREKERGKVRWLMPNRDNGEKRQWEERERD